MKRRFNTIVVATAAVFSAFLSCSALADNTPQSLPFSQDWSNIGLITVANDWSGVPGIVGHRGDDITTATGTDPQTLLADGTTTPVNVVANQTNPNTNTSGGIAEFHLSNPVVALQGSGTADAPFLLINISTAGNSNVTVSYVLRDIDGSTDNAIQQIALHYRVGTTGDFTNIPSAYVADATTGPSLARLVTAVTAVLPGDALNQPHVQLRIMTTNAVSNDEWVGVDDIVIFEAIDTDGDGVPDIIDNCPSIPNPGQEDCDDNGIGDACDAPCPPDTDGDGIIDSLDNCPFHFNPDQTDCNNNGIGDVCEIANDPKLDCNENGIVDTCEPDCNNSGLPDDCDIAFGISQDCNTNGIPDECETANDCNSNGVPDDCDIALGFSEDSNNNGIPDDCENLIAVVLNEILADPAAGAAGDSNNDGVTNSSQDEFIEIINVSGSTVNISGWTIEDDIALRHVFPNNTVIGNNCGIIVWGGGAPSGQFGGFVKQTASNTNGFGLNNTGDTVTLRDAAGLLVGRHTYGSEGGQDVSLTRDPDITGPFVQHNIATPGSVFSPGLTNDFQEFGGCPPVLPDQDNDGIPDANDNCPALFNPFQEDCNGNSIGDVCDLQENPELDGNGNGIIDSCELAGPPIRLNEIRIDEPGADNNEYVEIKGPAGTSLSGVTLLVIGDGSAAQGSGVIEAVVSLQGQTIPADGHFLMVESTFALAPIAQRDLILGSAGLNFENGDHVTYLLVTNFFGSAGQDLDTNNDGVLDITPWVDVADAVGFISAPLPPVGNEWAYGASLGFTDVGPDGMFVPGQIYRCETAGTWTIGVFDPFNPAGATDTAGVSNLSCPSDPCPGDRNQDGQVNVDDLLILLALWGTNDPVGDINGDGLVNVDDLLILLAGWGLCP